MGNRPSQSGGEATDDGFQSESDSAADAAPSSFSSSPHVLAYSVSPADCASTLSLVSNGGGGDRGHPPGAGVGGGSGSRGGLHNLAFAPSLKDVNVAVAAAVAAAAAAAAATAAAAGNAAAEVSEDEPEQAASATLSKQPQAPQPQPLSLLPPRPQQHPRSCLLSSSSDSASSASPPPTSRPRICPILQNGRQVTKDFYWVLPERRTRQLSRQRSLQEASRPLPAPPPQLPTPPQPPPKVLLDVVDTREPLRMDNSGLRLPEYQNLPALPPRRVCRSESSGGFGGGGGGGGGGQESSRLVALVLRDVPGVTEEESRLALGLHGWDPGRAARYLKIEQLFRLGLADRSVCLAELEAAGWQLESAGAALLDRMADWS